MKTPKNFEEIKDLLFCVKNTETKYTLLKSIPAGTIIKDLYDDGEMFFLLDGNWHPWKLNNFKDKRFLSKETKNI